MRRSPNPVNQPAAQARIIQATASGEIGENILPRGRLRSAKAMESALNLIRYMWQSQDLATNGRPIPETRSRQREPTSVVARRVVHPI